MVEFKCKFCGAVNRIESYLTDLACDYCGRVVELDENREKFVNLYRKADDAWDRKDFDEALKCYEEIVALDTTQTEAHWGAALSRYGVEYVDDYMGNKKPTCHRISRSSILADNNYLTAIKYAGERAREEYVPLAKEIDRINTEFMKIVDQEAPYDVFISYKSSDANHKRTVDAQYARKLYLYLQDKGYKVFFAEESLKAKAGTMYEPYIFSALTTAPIMFLFGSCKEYLEATWVKNEWRRFLALAQDDPSKVLIPTLVNAEAYETLPSEMLAMQALQTTDAVFNEEAAEIVRKKLKAKEKKNAPATDLNARYAPQDKVDKLVEITDCEPAFAAEALVLHHGRVDAAEKWIKEDPAYQKKFWVCTECNSINTHDLCRKCGVSRKQSIDIAKKREQIKRKRQMQSAEHKKKVGKTIGAIIKWGIALAIIFAIISGLSNCVKGIGKSISEKNAQNASVEDLYTPELVGTYVGTYRNGQAIVNIDECSSGGGLKGSFEFIVKDNVYGKYQISGQITDKRVSGAIKFTMTPGEWVVQPSGYTPLDEMTVSVSKDGTTLTGSDSLNVSTAASLDNAIDQASDLNKLNNSEGVFVLGSDIDLGGDSITPIAGFKGIFLGNGHKLSNFTITGSGTNVGLFADLQGTVNGLTLENATVTASGRTENVGILCGTLTGTAANIQVSGTVEAENGTNVGGVAGLVAPRGDYAIGDLHSTASVSGESNVGGVIGQYQNTYDYSGVMTKFVDMSNTGNVTGTGENIGGIIGMLGQDKHSVNVTGFSNTGDVSGKLNVGGIVGYADNDSSDDSVLSECTFSGSVTGEAYVGGIAGVAKELPIRSCSNEGATVVATKYVTNEGHKNAYLGGYVGYGYLVDDCTNAIDITYSAGGSYVGGIAGYLAPYSDFSMSGLSNTGSITGNAYVGGIVGCCVNTYSYSGVTGEFSSFTNSGAVSGTGDYIGGVGGYIGNSDHEIKISDFSNSGSVSGVKYVGGVVGYAEGNESSESYASTVSCAAEVSGEAYIGCIAGCLDGIILRDATNTGSTLYATGYVTTENGKFAYVGGLVGYGYTAEDSVNEVAITYTGGGNCVGGIFGFAAGYSDCVFSGLKNLADISGAGYVGGIAGNIHNTYSYSGATHQMYDMVNDGNISGTGNYVGGIFGGCGHSNHTIHLSDLVNNGSVNGGGYVGGIFGYFWSNDSSTIVDCINNGSSSGYNIGQTESGIKAQ